MDLLEDRKILPGLFFSLVRALFSSRRKTIRNTLSAFVSSVIIKSKPLDTVAAVLRNTGISGDRRPETLNIDEFAALAAVLEDLVNCG
jgi:16S rRNA (adenine1518-N6/adenine1519-N6)-dimethyltransferase